MGSPHTNALGSVAGLSVGAGDIKLSFDKSNPAERIRAARIVRDMLRRGFAILIEVEVKGVKKFTRALDFDESVCEYILADFDPITAAEQDEQEAENGQQESEPIKDEAAAGPKAKRGSKRSKIPAESARAVAVGRTAGG